jgi:hypothetical protein
MCCTLWLSTPVPQRGTGVPLEYYKGCPLRGSTWATTRIGDRHRAIRAPRSGRLLLQRDLISELVNTVVSDLGPRQARKNGEVRALRY